VLQPHDFSLTLRLYFQLVSPTLPYDVSPDGQRFLLIRAKEQNAPGEVRVVLNWSEELKRLAPSAQH
jgi:hypothetical protein